MPIRDITGINDGSDLFPDGTDSSNQNINSLNTISSDSGTDTQDIINQLVNEHSQGYIGLLSDFYFDGAGTSTELLIADVDVWQDVVMTVHPNGVSDQRVEDMKEAQAVGYSGDGSLGSPIRFLLEGLVEASFATLRTSLDFTPDEDGGRLDSRLFVERHIGAGPDFSIAAAGLAMESGADEAYPHLINVEFFVGDTIDTNGPNDAGKVRFQIKSDVTGTVTMKEMALFINR